MNLIKAIGLVLVFSGIVMGCYLFSISYDSFIVIVSDFVGVSNIVGIPDPEGKFRNLITSKVFFQIKLISFLPIIIGSLIFNYSGNLHRNTEKIVLALSNISDEVKLIEKKYLIIACMVLLASLVCRLYYAFYPITYDEAWTYIYFTSKGFLTSISFYPVPNNQVLHSILTNLTYYFPFSQTLNLRIPSLLIGIASVAVFYLTFRKIFDDRIALWLMSIFSFLYPVLFYGFKARGYSLVILSSVICFYGAVQIVRSTKYDDVKQYWFYLSFGAVMGLYSLPSFLYPYFAFTTFLAFTLLYRRNIKQLITLFTSVFITGAITVILYSPIFIVSGFSSMSNNQGVKVIPRYEVLGSLFAHFTETFGILFYSEWVLLLVVFLSAFLLTRPKINVENKLASYVIFISPVILLIHSVIAVPRTWVHLVVPILFLLGSLMKNLPADKNGTLLGGSAIILIGFLVFNFNAYINKYEKFSFEADKLSSLLISNNANKIYINHYLIKTNLIYLFEEKGAQVDIVSSRPGLFETNQIAENNFDYLILGEQINNIPGYKLIEKLCAQCRLKARTYVYAKA